MTELLATARRHPAIAAAALAALIAIALAVVFLLAGSGSSGRDDQVAPAPTRAEVAAALLASDPTGAAASDERLAAIAREDLGLAGVIAEEAHRRGVTVRPELVDEQMALVARACCGGDRAAMSAWLAARGADATSLRSVISTRLAADALQGEIVREARPKIAEPALRAAYRARRAALAQPERRQVLIARLATLADARDARAKLVAADGPGEREALIRELSQDPSAPGGGLITLRRPAPGMPDTDPALTRAAFSLSTGAVSAPIRSEGGGFVVAVARDDTEPALAPTFSQARRVLLEQLQAEAGQRAFARLAARLAKEAGLDDLAQPAGATTTPAPGR